jgi:hypothetical protein
MRPSPLPSSGAVYALGVIQIVLGGFAALCVLFGVFSALTLSSRAGVNSFVMVLPFLSYVLPATNLLVTGIGSVRFRPWARLATIISAGIWGGIGVMAIFGTFAFRFLSRASSEPMPLAATLVLVIFMGLFFVAFPILLITLYSTASARAAFAARRQPQ